MKIVVMRCERGSVLMISLVILLVLTLLGIGGMNTTILQERMAGNASDRELAFQAAEAALRDGERFVSVVVQDSTVFNTACDGGLCEPSTNGYDVWESTVAWSAAIGYGSQTGLSNLPVVSAQPSFIAERMQVVEKGNELTVGFSAPTGPKWYRVSARGYGKNQAAQATVQSVFKP